MIAPRLILRFTVAFLICLKAMNASAQTDSLPPPDIDAPEIEEAIEDLILNAEVDEQVDYSYLTDGLEEFLRKPLDINSASREALLLLPGMTELKINDLQNHIRQFGPLTSVYELQAVPRYQPDFIRQVLPYITVKSIGAKDISPGTEHASAPSWKNIWKDLKFELRQRVTWIGEEQKGYTDPDTAFIFKPDDDGNLVVSDTALTSRYAGSPYRIYTRLRATASPNFSFALTGEKDPGEVFKWDPENRQYGYDYLSGHISLRDFGRLKRLVVGDYILQVGQGLVLSRGIGFGKGVQVINNVKRPNQGIQPYSSVNEAQFLRGAAATYAFGKVYLTGFVSRNWVDAGVQDRDTLTEEAVLATSIQLGGLHRTASEIANRRAVRESMYGGRLEYKSPTLTIGTTNYYQSFSSELSPRPNPYNQYVFRGNENYINGIDFDWVYQNINVFGEFARSKSGGTGGILGIMSSLSPTVDVSILARRFTRDFHSSKGYVFAERPTALQNETGIYLGLKIMPNPRWELNAYVDQYYFPWSRFQAFYPSRGWEFLSQLSFKPKRGTEIYLRYRTDNKERNATQGPPDQQLAYLIPTNKTQFRLHFQTKIGRDIQLRNRLEFSWYTQGEEESHRGVLLYQDLSWKLNYKIKFTGRYAIFDISDYQARIYAYENDILGFFTIPPYYGKGSRYYLIFNWKPVRNLEFWARVAQTHWLRATSIGSGLEGVEGPNRTEFKLQVRWKF